MNKQQEALKLALEALENAWLDASMGKGDVARHTEAITAIREALAEQPAQQQEPVALDVTVEGDAAKLLASMLEPVLDDEPTPIRLLVGKGHSGHGLYVAAAEYQEEGAALLVNTSPPASKPWVGLDEEEIEKCCFHADSIEDNMETWKWTLLFYEAVATKLREKNA